MSVGSLPISLSRAHASRAIPPVALGIELKPVDFVNFMLKSIPIHRRPMNRGPSSVGIDLRQATLRCTFWRGCA
jgi:hypothetical protein